MYLKYYNLTLKPFEISPDPKFLWLGEKHKEALAAIKYGILDNKGFISLTGDAGTGKTTLVNTLSNSLGDNFIFAQVPDPSLDQLDFLNLMADSLNMNKKFSTKGDFLSHLGQFLADADDNGKTVVLVIEEAQRFDQERLEEFRLLSNIEKPDKKLLNILFVGQNEFDDILKQNEALRQRVFIAHEIKPLQESETDQYIRHRLKIAGSEKKIFSSEAVHEIYSFSEGNPRLINIICDSALVSGFAEEKAIIGPEIIKECAANYLLPKKQKDVAIEDGVTSSESVEETGAGIKPGMPENLSVEADGKIRQRRGRFRFAYVAAIFVVILLGIFGYLYLSGENQAAYRKIKTFLQQVRVRIESFTSKTPTQNPNEIQTPQGDVGEPPSRMADFNAGKAEIASQPGRVGSSQERPAVDLQKLKKADERISELESAMATREQKVAELAKALAREKRDREQLDSKLSAKTAKVGELQQKLEAAFSSRAALVKAIAESKTEVAGLQDQLSDLKAQKAASDSQLGELRSRNEALMVDLEELKAAKERIAELEGAAQSGQQALSHSEQKVADLAKALDQEKKDREQLGTEFSAKTDQVGELQRKLEAALASRAALENTVEAGKMEIAGLQGQLSDLKAQKAASDSRLGELRSRNETLMADLEELKGAKERVVELESVAQSGQQALSQSEQKVADLAKALDQEKKEREQLGTELSAKTDQVGELQRKLEAALASRTALENSIETGKMEIAGLQGQLSDLKVQKAASESRLGELKSRTEALLADLEELKGAKERVVELQDMAQSSQQALSQSEQKVTELTNALDQAQKDREQLGTELSAKTDQVGELEEAVTKGEEKLAELANELDQEQKRTERLSAELSAKADLVAGLEQKLQTSQSEQQDADNTIKSNEKEIAELKNVLNKFTAQGDATESSADREIPVLEAQLSALQAQNTTLDTQLSELKSRNETLRSELDELKNEKGRFVELEKASVDREQKLSRSEQKVIALTNALDREKMEREQLRSEVSAMANLVSELQQKLETALTSRSALEEDIAERKTEIADLQAQLMDLKAQKASSDSQLAGLQSRNEALVADLEELKGAAERVAALQEALATGEQKLADLARELDLEKKDKDLLKAELLTKTDLVTEFKQKLQTSQASRQELEQTINSSKKEIAELRNQMGELKAQQAPTGLTPVVSTVKEEPASKIETSAGQAETPSPSAIIDWVLKKKAK